MMPHQGLLRSSAALVVSFLFATALQATPAVASATADGPIDTRQSGAGPPRPAADPPAERSPGRATYAAPSSSASTEPWVDAARIAYIFENGVWTVNPDGTGATRITPTSFSARQPAWSPDGTKIAFAYVASSLGDPGYGIWTVDAGGTGLTQVTTEPAAVAGNDTHPAWSPDGSKIAFTRGRDLYVMNANGTGVTNLTAGGLPPGGGAPRNADWSPDRTKIAFDDGFEIFTITPNGTGLVQLTPPGGAKMIMPSWSPDGTSIVFHNIGGPSVMRMAPDGSGLTTVASNTNSIWGVAHSPATSDLRIAVIRQITFPGQGVSIIDGSTGAITDIVPSAGAFGVSWAGVPGTSPAARAEEMKAAGATCNEIALEMMENFSLTATQIATILKFVGCSAMQTAEALRDLFEPLVDDIVEFVAHTLYQAGFDSFTIAGVLKGLFNLLGLTWARIGQKIGIPTTEVAQALKDVFEVGPSGAWAILKDLFPVEEVARALKDVYNLTAQQLAQIWKGVGVAVITIATVLKTVYDRTPAQAAQILKNVGFGAQAITNALKNVFGRTAQQTGQILIQLGFGAEAIANALDKFFSLTIGFLAKILSLKFAATQIAKVLKAVRKATDAAITKALEFAGFKVIAIIRALRDGLGKTAQQAASLLKGAGFTAKQIATGLKNVFSRTGTQTASILKSVGFGAKAVAQALKDVYGLGKVVVKSILLTVGYAVSAVTSAICSVFKC